MTPELEAAVDQLRNIAARYADPAQNPAGARARVPLDAVLPIVDALDHACAERDRLRDAIAWIAEVAWTESEHGDFGVEEEWLTLHESVAGLPQPLLDALPVGDAP